MHKNHRIKKNAREKEKKSSVTEIKGKRKRRDWDESDRCEGDGE